MKPTEIGFLDAILKHWKDKDTTVGHVPWILAGDESGAFKPGSSERFACFALVGIPVLKYYTFVKSLPKPDQYKYSENQVNSIVSLLFRCWGTAAVIHFDLNNTGVKKYEMHLESLRRTSNLSKPAATANVVWLNALSFSIFEFISWISTKHLPVGNIRIFYDEKTMSGHMKNLMQSYVPKQIDYQLRQVFESVAAEYPTDPLPKAKPQIVQFEAGKTKEPMIQVADILARLTFRALHEGKSPQFRGRLLIKDMTETLIAERE